MERIVVLSAQELYDLIRDHVVKDEKTGVLYMSEDCYKKYLNDKEL